jgi:selenocysteine-specific elongation factor
VIIGDIAATPVAWQKSRERAVEMIDHSHSTHPERTGLDLSIFRAAFRDLAPEIAEALLDDLCRDGFARTGQSIARQTHETALPSQLEPVAAKILHALGAKPFDPPARKVVAPDSAAREALQFLIGQGCIADVSPEVVLRAEDFDRMKDVIVRFLSARGPATASQIRQELQSSRRIIIPLLECLDRRGITRRVGDHRILAH